MKTIINESVLRFALLSFNFIFLMLSVSLIALSIAYTQELSVIKWYIGTDFISFPAVLLFLGSLSFIMSIAGCYSAKSKNKFFFILFIGTFVCLLILELTIAITGFIKAGSNFQNDVKTVMTSQISSKDPAEKVNFHDVEKILKCCGIDGPDDYYQSNWQEEGNKCCEFEECSLELSKNFSDIWYKGGCAYLVNKEILRVAHDSAKFFTAYSSLQVLEIACGAFLIYSLSSRDI